MTVGSGSATDKKVNHGGITNTHDVTTAQYDASRIKAVVPWASAIDFSIGVVMTMKFG